MRPEEYAKWLVAALAVTLAQCRTVQDFADFAAAAARVKRYLDYHEIRHLR